MQTTFTTVILGFGNNTGIEVPASALDELGAGKRPPVRVDVNGYQYQGSVGAMGGKSLISLSKAHRDASGLKAGDEVTVTLTLESADRAVEVPEALEQALAEAGLAEAFAVLTYGKRKEHARQVADAKTDATRDKRVAKVLESLA